MSGGTGEPSDEFLHSDTNYQQKWREETKVRLLQRAKIRKEQSFPELAQKLKLSIKRENIIAQKAIDFLKCVRESRYGLLEESFSTDGPRLTSSTHVDYPLPNAGSHAVPGSKPYNPSFVAEVCDKTVRPPKFLYEQDTLDHSKTSKISVLRDFEDTIDKVDDKIRNISLLGQTEQDINTPTETRMQNDDTHTVRQFSPVAFTTYDGCINKFREEDLQSLNDLSVKTNEISILSDSEDTVDKVDDKIRKMSLLSDTEQDISNTPIEKQFSPETFTTSDGCINESFENDLENISDVSVTCSLKTDVGLNHLVEKQEGHFRNRNAVAREKTHKNKTSKFEKLMFKSAKNKRIARIYLNRLPVISQLDNSMIPKSRKI